MRTVRYALLVLFAFVPALVLAQLPDSVHVEIEGTQYPGYGAAFGERFPPDTNLGPFPLTLAQGTGETAPPAQGCDPFVNADQVEGSVVLIERGVCTFVQKVLNAQEAGAEVVVVFNGDPVPDDDNSLVLMGGECTPSECTIPAAFISRASALAVLTEDPFNPMATIIPIRILPPPPPATVGTHDTGPVQFDGFDYGFFGRDVEFNGTGFVFGGFDGLFVGSVLVGIDGEVVTNPYNGLSEWTAVSEVQAITPPAPFDQAFQTSFENVDFGIHVTERSYSRARDPFVMVELDLQNISGSDINDVYIGLFADFDAGSAHTDDMAAVNEDLNLVYVYDPVEAAPYFGVVAIGAGLFSLSGYSADATTGDDSQLFEALTSEVEIAPDPAERAVVIGVGPFDMPAGASSGAMFAFVGGSDEAELLANASFPITDPQPSVEETAPEGTYVLASAYPNPFTDRTTITFVLPMAQDIRLVVYDVLGREVAVLVDGARPAGEQAVDFDASALPSGVYLARLEAGAVRLVERVTVVR